MIFGIGTDLLRVDRIARVYARHGARFIDKILMPEERAALEGLSDPVNRIAKSFAAKEAFVKAWGTGFAGVNHHDVGVARAASGAPELIFSSAMQARLAAAGVLRCHLSLSDDDGRVLSFVVLECGEPQIAPAPVTAPQADRH